MLLLSGRIIVVVAASLAAAAPPKAWTKRRTAVAERYSAGLDYDVSNDKADNTDQSYDDDQNDDEIHTGPEVTDLNSDFFSLEDEQRESQGDDNFFGERSSEENEPKSMRVFSSRVTGNATENPDDGVTSLGKKEATTIHTVSIVSESGDDATGGEDEDLEDEANQSEEQDEATEGELEEDMEENELAGEAQDVTSTDSGLLGKLLGQRDATVGQSAAETEASVLSLEEEDVTTISSLGDKTDLISAEEDTVFSTAENETDSANATLDLVTSRNTAHANLTEDDTLDNYEDDVEDSNTTSAQGTTGLHLTEHTEDTDTKDTGREGDFNDVAQSNSTVEVHHLATATQPTVDFNLTEEGTSEEVMDAKDTVRDGSDFNAEDATEIGSTVNVDNLITTTSEGADFNSTEKRTSEEAAVDVKDAAQVEGSGFNQEDVIESNSTDDLNDLATTTSEGTDFNSTKKETSEEESVDAKDAVKERPGSNSEDVTESTPIGDVNDLATTTSEGADFNSTEKENPEEETVDAEEPVKERHGFNLEDLTESTLTDDVNDLVTKTQKGADFNPTEKEASEEDAAQGSSDVFSTGDITGSNFIPDMTSTTQSASNSPEKATDVNSWPEQTTDISLEEFFGHLEGFNSSDPEADLSPDNDTGTNEDTTELEHKEASEPDQNEEDTDAIQETTSQTEVMDDSDESLGPAVDYYNEESSQLNETKSAVDYDDSPINVTEITEESNASETTSGPVGNESAIVGTTEETAASNQATTDTPEATNAVDAVGTTNSEVSNADEEESGVHPRFRKARKKSSDGGPGGEDLASRAATSEGSASNTDSVGSTTTPVGDVFGDTNGNGDEGPFVVRNRTVEYADGVNRSVCDAPPSGPGTCLGRTIAYTWVGDSCARFPYGGCGATENFFSTKKECLELCSPSVEAENWLNQLTGGQVVSKSTSTTTAPTTAEATSTSTGVTTTAATTGVNNEEIGISVIPAIQIFTPRCQKPPFASDYTPDVCKSYAEHERVPIALYTYKWDMCLSVKFYTCGHHILPDSDVTENRLKDMNLFRTHEDCINECKWPDPRNGKCVGHGGNYGSCKPYETADWHVKWAYDGKDDGWGRCIYYWYSGCDSKVENLYGDRHSCWRSCLRRGNYFANEEDRWVAIVTEAGRKKYGKDRYYRIIWEEGFDFGAELGHPMPEFMGRLTPNWDNYNSSHSVYPILL